MIGPGSSLDEIRDWLARIGANEAAEDFNQPHVVLSYILDPDEDDDPSQAVAAVVGPFPDFVTAAGYADGLLAEVNADEVHFGVALRRIFEPTKR